MANLKVGESLVVGINTNYRRCYFSQRTNWCTGKEQQPLGTPTPQRGMTIIVTTQGEHRIYICTITWTCLSQRLRPSRFGSSRVYHYDTYLIRSTPNTDDPKASCNRVGKNQPHRDWDSFRRWTSQHWQTNQR